MAVVSVAVAATSTVASTTLGLKRKKKEKLKIGRQQVYTSISVTFIKLGFFLFISETGIDDTAGF